MQKNRPALLAILMMTAALAGCVSGDTSDLDAQIEDLGSQNTELTQTVAERDEEISQLNEDIEQQQHLISDLNTQVQGLLEGNSALEAEIEKLEAQLANASASIEGIMSEIPDPLEGCYLLEPAQSWALDPCPPTIFIIGDNPSNWNQHNNSNYIDEGAACWNGTEWASHEVHVSGQVVDLSRVATYEVRYDCGEATQVTRIVNVV